MKDRIAICYDLPLKKEYGLFLKFYIILNCMHSLIIGATGSGKSTFLKLCLASLLDTGTVNIWFLDFKNSTDFSILQGYNQYFSGDDCIIGLEQIYAHFQKCRADPSICANTYTAILFDELPSYLLYLAGKDKKQAEQHKSMISEILMLGRSLKFGFLCAMQRPDAQYLSNGARDNFFNIIALGNLSSESKQMVFAGQDIPDTIFHTGEGLLLQSGKPLEQIGVPRMDGNDIRELDRFIQKRLGIYPE